MGCRKETVKVCFCPVQSLFEAFQLQLLGDRSHALDVDVGPQRAVGQPAAGLAHSDEVSAVGDGFGRESRARGVRRPPDMIEPQRFAHFEKEPSIIFIGVWDDLRLWLRGFHGPTEKL